MIFWPGLMSRDILQLSTAFTAIYAFKCFVFVCAVTYFSMVRVLHSAHPRALIFGMWLQVCPQSALIWWIITLQRVLWHIANLFFHFLCLFLVLASYSVLTGVVLHREHSFRCRWSFLEPCWWCSSQIAFSLSFFVVVASFSFLHELAEVLE